MQRLCAIPDADFFQSICSGKVSIATGHIERIGAASILMRDGEKVDADVIVKATGLQLQKNFPASTIKISIDGEEYDAPKHAVYLGCMLSNVPNLAFTMGYANASWTLKADLVSQQICCIINEMKRRGETSVRPVLNNGGLSASGEEAFFALSSGYLQRARHRMPKQFAADPWNMPQNYFKDLWRFWKIAKLGIMPKELEFRHCKKNKDIRASKL